MLRLFTKQTKKGIQINNYSTLLLKDVIENQIPTLQEKIKLLKKEHGNKIIDKVTLNQCLNGSRGIRSLYWEPSLLDAENGIRIRDKSINECQEELPSFKKDGVMSTESMLWLLMTGNVPNNTQIDTLRIDLQKRAKLPLHVINFIRNLPKDTHPMNSLSCAIALCQSESLFMKAYQEGVPKSDYWKYTYEDIMNIIAKLPVIASMIYRSKYYDDYDIPQINSRLDYAANFCNMMGFENEEFHELMRLYLCIHSDHEGGNASAHTTHLVGSTLADPYISYASGLNALAGPLHGSANAEVLKWIQELKFKFKEENKELNEENMRLFVYDTLESGKVIPGYGHAVLRKTDPRYTCQRDFALKYLPDDELFHVVEQLYKVVPPILKDLGKVQNPYPNVDNHSGILLRYYGMNEYQYYTVLFGVSRSMGALSQLLLDRILNMPIERPKSLDYNSLVNMTK